MKYNNLPIIQFQGISFWELFHPESNISKVLDSAETNFIIKIKYHKPIYCRKQRFEDAIEFKGWFIGY